MPDCTCTHADDEHETRETGFQPLLGACTVAIVDVWADRETGAVRKQIVHCPCLVFERDKS